MTPAPGTARRLTYTEFVLLYGTPDFGPIRPNRMRLSDDLSGLIFGKLWVDKVVTGSATDFLGLLWDCRCACFAGRRQVWAKHLLSGSIQDCGCRKQYRIRKRRQRRKLKTATMVTNLPKTNRQKC
jgi:hypothetical protein